MKKPDIIQSIIEKNIDLDAYEKIDLKNITAVWTALTDDIQWNIFFHFIINNTETPSFEIKGDPLDLDQAWEHFQDAILKKDSKSLERISFFTLTKEAQEKIFKIAFLKKDYAFKKEKLFNIFSFYISKGDTTSIEKIWDSSYITKDKKSYILKKCFLEGKNTNIFMKGLSLKSILDFIADGGLEKDQDFPEFSKKLSAYFFSKDPKYSKNFLQIALEKESKNYTLLSWIMRSRLYIPQTFEDFNEFPLAFLKKERFLDVIDYVVWFIVLSIPFEGAAEEKKDVIQLKELKKIDALYAKKSLSYEYDVIKSNMEDEKDSHPFLEKMIGIPIGITRYFALGKRHLDIINENKYYPLERSFIIDAILKKGQKELEKLEKDIMLDIGKKDKKIEEISGKIEFFRAEKEKFETLMNTIHDNVQKEIESLIVCDIETNVEEEPRLKVYWNMDKIKEHAECISQESSYPVFYTLFFLEEKAIHYFLETSKNGFSLLLDFVGKNLKKEEEKIEYKTLQALSNFLKNLSPSTLKICKEDIQKINIRLLSTFQNHVLKIGSDFEQYEKIINPYYDFFACQIKNGLFDLYEIVEVIKILPEQITLEYKFFQDHDLKKINRLVEVLEKIEIEKQYSPSEVGDLYHKNIIFIIGALDNFSKCIEKTPVQSSEGKIDETLQKEKKEIQKRIHQLPQKFYKIMVEKYKENLTSRILDLENFFEKNNFTSITLNIKPLISSKGKKIPFDACFFQLKALEEMLHDFIKATQDKIRTPSAKSSLDECQSTLKKLLGYYKNADKHSSPSTILLYRGFDEGDPADDKPDVPDSTTVPGP